MNDITKRKVERISQITAQIAALEAELNGLLNGSLKPVAKEATEKESRKYTKRSLTPEEQQRIRQAIIDLVVKGGSVHPRFVYNKVRGLGLRLNFMSITQYMRHMRDDGVLNQNDTGLYSLKTTIGVSVGGLVGPHMADKYVNEMGGNPLPNGFNYR